MAPKSPASRAKAYRLRTAIEDGEDVTDEDRAWLSSYEAGSNSLQQASERLVHIEERQAVNAEGPAAEAAAMAGFAREEGRRLDHLLGIAMQAMGRACDMYHRMAADLLAQNAQTQAATQDLLATIREHYLARIAAEGQADLLQQAMANGGAEMTPEQMLMQVLMAGLQAKQAEKQAAASKPADPTPAAK